MLNYFFHLKVLHFSLHLLHIPAAMALEKKKGATSSKKSISFHAKNNKKAPAFKKQAAKKKFSLSLGESPGFVKHILFLCVDVFTTIIRG